MLPTLLGRVQHLFEFIHLRPQPVQLISYLGENFCSLGEVAAVAISTLHDDGRIVCDNAFGFLHNERMVGATSSIQSDRPGSQSLATLKNLILNSRDIDHKFPDFVIQDFMTGFESAVLMPIGVRKIYGIALQKPIKDIEGITEYVECVSSLISFYETAISGSLQSDMKSQMPASKELTPRQEIILGMIKDGKTNIGIAAELGYSESLIRQETIIIYRKLGIDGRKELRHHENH